MKLSDYAKHLGVSYQTAWRWWKAGTLPHPATQAESGTVIVDFAPETESIITDKIKVAIYARVSSSENKDRQRRAKRKTERIIQELSKDEECS
ncbi:MAG: hypothetical protein U7127_02335 [Phormidium sp.]